MTNYYFERLNSHVINIELTEDKLRKLWAKFLEKNPNPEFTQWCVFLAQNQVQFFYWTTTPKEYVKV